jgi:hypothetical protein
MSMIDWWRIFPPATASLKIRLNDTGVTALPQGEAVVVPKNVL